MQPVKPLTLAPKFIDTNHNALGSAAGLNMKSRLVCRPKQPELLSTVQCLSFVRSAWLVDAHEQVLVGLHHLHLFTLDDDRCQ